MLLVVLGAGASYDSAGEKWIEPARRHKVPESRPPLADGLFDPRAHFLRAVDSFPDCRSLVVSLRAKLADGNRTLEQELDTLSVKASTNARAATQLMAVRYYLQQILQTCGVEWSLLTHGCTNYHFLVERLDEWARDRGECVLYVTFNYDTLLERAIEDAGPKLHFLGIGDYVANARLKLFKVHGSVDWAHIVHLDPPFPTGAQRDYVIAHAIDVEIPPDIVFRPDQNSGTNGQAWVPALAVPIETKGEFECPSDHITMLKDLLPEVDSLLIIGWRGMEQHFLRMLAGHTMELQRVLVACNDERESQATLGRIATAKGGLSTRGYRNWENSLGFSGLASSKELDEFLA